MFQKFRRRTAPGVEINKRNFHKKGDITNFRVDTQNELDKLSRKQSKYKSGEKFLSKLPLQRSLSAPSSQKRHQLLERQQSVHDNRRLRPAESNTEEDIPVSAQMAKQENESGNYEVLKEEQIKRRISDEKEYVKETRRIAYKQMNRHLSLTSDEKKVFSATYQQTKASPLLSPRISRSTPKRLSQQMGTYINWINTQLEKRNANPHKVADLTKDMRDGVIFLLLVEVIGNEKQTIINHPNMTTTDMMKNVDNVLNFLSKNDVRVHHIVAKDIVAGNVKATMRLVLALAAHFKPDTFKYTYINSPKHVTQQKKKPFSETPRHKRLTKTPSLTSLANDAAASLAEASKNATSAPGMSLHYRYRNAATRYNASNSSTSSSTSVSKKKELFKEKNNLQQKPLKTSQRDVADIFPSPRNSPYLNEHHVVDIPLVPQPNVRSSLQIHVGGVNKDGSQSLQNGGSMGSCMDNEQHEEMFNDLQSTREMLEQMQALLLQNADIDACVEEENKEENELKKQEMMCQDLQHLKSQLEEFQKINKRLSNEKTAYETRISQQEQQILSLKSKLLEYEVKKKNDVGSLELRALLEEKNNELQLVHAQLNNHMNTIEKQTNEINALSNDVVSKSRAEAYLHTKLESSESMVSNLQNEVKDLTERMHHMTCGDFYSPIIGGGDHNISVTSKINETNYARDKQRNKTIVREQSNIIITLNNIRQQFDSDDPIHHALQSIEQSLMSLVQSVSLNMNSKSTDGRQSSNSTQFPRSSNSSDSGYDHNGNVSVDGMTTTDPTKVVYFMGKSITPVLKISDVGIGYLTLRDFKSLINRPGKYRYFFKSMDRDFGFVREEVLFDDDLVPGHENKVVAWIEKDVSDEV